MKFRSERYVYLLQDVMTVEHELPIIYLWQNWPIMLHHVSDGFQQFA